MYRPSICFGMILQMVYFCLWC